MNSQNQPDTETGGEIKVIDTALGPRPRASLEAVAAMLEKQGTTIEWLRIKDRGLPRRPGKDAKRTWASFAATPPSLMNSWRIARHAEAATAPGDVVLMSDYHGGSGVFALEQAALPPEERRHVVIVAADSALLEYLAVTGTFQGVVPETEFALDWELVAYRWADAVLATSEFAVRSLADLGVEATLVLEAAARSPKSSDHAPTAIDVPEPISRLAQTPRVLRALSGLIERPALEITLSEKTHRDRIWSGTTWDALMVQRSLFEGHLTRGDPKGPPDVVVLGDPFALPDDRVAAQRAGGVPVVTFEGSTAAALWPDTPTWSDEHSLATLLAAPITAADRPAGDRQFSLGGIEPDDSRGQRVSVAVPIFREVRYLDECVRSILDQTQPAHEVLLVDDGSNSPEVDAAIAYWCEAFPDVVRSITQPNRGVSAARNTALTQMTGDSFVLVDSDDTLQPEFIAACAVVLRSYPDVWAVATWTEFFGAYEAIEAKPPFDARVGLRENPIISTPALVDMRVRDLGIRYSPDLAFLFCEDWEVWAKIIAAGGRFGLVPRALARHRVHRSSGGFQRTTLAHSLGKARATATLRQVT